MKALFDFKLYKEALKKTKLLGIGCAAVTILISALFPLITILTQNKVQFTDLPGNEPYIESITNGMFAPLLILLVIFTPFFFYSMFSFLTKRNESDFYHAIPFKRQTVCLCFSAAIFTWLWGTALVSLLLNALLWSLCKYYTFSFLLIPKLFGLMVFATLYFGGFVLLAITLTGTHVSGYSLTLVFFLLFRLVALFFTTVLGSMVEYVDFAKSFLMILSTKYWFPAALIQGFYNDLATFANVPLWIWSSLVTVAFYVLGFHFYRTRKSETASKSAPSPLLQHLFRCAFTLPFALLTLMFIMLDEDFSVVLVFLVITLLVYYLYELIMSKSIKSTLKCTPYLLVIVGLCLVFTGAVYGSRYAILSESTDPKDIAEVGFYQKEGSLFDFEDLFYDRDGDYEELMTSKLLISADEAKQIVSTAWERTKTFDQPFLDKYTRWDVLIKRPSGKEIGRELVFTTEEFSQLNTLFAKSEEFLNLYLAMPKEKEISSFIVYVDGTGVNFNVDGKVWNCFVKEYETLSKEEKMAMKSNEELYAGFFSDYRLSVVGKVGSDRFCSEYAVPTKCKETAEMLKLLADKRIGEILDEMKDSLETAKKHIEEEDGGSFEIYGTYAYSVKEEIYDEKTGMSSVYDMTGTDYCSLYIGINSEKERELALRLIDFLYGHIPSKEDFRTSSNLQYNYSHYEKSIYEYHEIYLSLFDEKDLAEFQKILNDPPVVRNDYDEKVYY